MDAHALDQRPIATHGGEWMVSLASWVIQDGNYGDFEVGTSRRFAIEFWADDLQPSSRTTRTAASVGGSRYAINANLAYVGDDLVMLDIGLVAYREVRANPKFPSPWVQGFISLGIDPFSYFETHARRRGVPPAIYGWDITGIWHETAPWISSEVTGFGTVDGARSGEARMGVARSNRRVGGRQRQRRIPRPLPRKLVATYA